MTRSFWKRDVSPAAVCLSAFTGGLVMHIASAFIPNMMPMLGFKLLALWEVLT
jgi:hypothetical protein